jgi:hypothetical protein
MQRDCPSKRAIIATADGGYVSASDIEDENIIAANILGFDDGAEEVLGTSATNNYRTLIMHLMRTSPLTIHPHLHQYLLQQHLLVLLLAFVLVGLPIK